MRVTLVTTVVIEIEVDLGRKSRYKVVFEIHQGLEFIRIDTSILKDFNLQLLWILLQFFAAAKAKDILQRVGQPELHPGQAIDPWSPQSEMVDLMWMIIFIIRDL